MGVFVAAAATGFVVLWLAVAPTVDPGELASAELRAARCGTCHPLNPPSMLSKGDWARVMDKMRLMLDRKFDVRYPEEEWAALLRYYQEKSPEELERLPPDPTTSPVRFESAPLPGPEPHAPGEQPNIQNVRVTDFDGDGKLDVIVCDGLRRIVSLVHRRDGTWVESALGIVPVAAHTEPTDWNGDGRMDLVVAVLGSASPTDDPVGQVVLLTDNGEGKYDASVVLSGVGRVADARPADLDGDGDVDFTVASFGHVVRGRIGWLEQKGGTFEFHTIDEGPGAIHVPAHDLDGDGDLDIVALISQHREEVVAFINHGGGDFERKNIFMPPAALFGSSGIELVDLDQDGDADILYTNGDAFDLEDVPPESYLRPYHGVRWLENRGNLSFRCRELAEFYGAYRATAGDLDGDGDLDVVVASGVNDWRDPNRRSLIWLENDGRMAFTAHGVASAPTHLVTAALGDLTGDGRVDIVAGGLHLPTIPGTTGRVTLWRNVGK